MATTAVGSTVLTLADWAKRLEPDGGITTSIVELLSITNEILTDMLWKEGNLPTGNRTTVRTGLPSVTWRILNKGVVPSKSTTAQLDEACGILEAWSEVDQKLAELEGDVASFRFSEAQAFIEAMNQEFASVLFYGNSGTTPEKFTGLSARYSNLSTAGNKQNVIDGGGTSSVNTSVYLVVWGANTVHGIFPKGSKAGLQHEDFGLQTVQNNTGIGTERMRAYQEQFTWDAGIALKDWRYVVRLANIDTTKLVAESAGYTDLQNKLIRMVHRVPTFGMGRAAFYMNRTVFEMLDIQRREDVRTGGQLKYEVVDGQNTPTFRGIPIRRSDSLLNTEAQVT